MRVTGGALRGRRLLSGGRTSSSLRPTQDRVREALFSILGDRVAEAEVADLFAGTGSLGIEALSRGARCAEFVESAASMVDVLRRNLSDLELASRARVVREPVERFLARSPQAPYHLMLADPPYDCGWSPRILQQVGAAPWLARDGLLVIERSVREPRREEETSDGLQLLDVRAYGETRLEIYARRDPNGEGG
jgi:16S rRNA (guanine966-N2)-methyltransferase